jgi:hypothetical protein
MATVVDSVGLGDLGMQWRITQLSTQEQFLSFVWHLQDSGHTELENLRQFENGHGNKYSH